MPLFYPSSSGTETIYDLGLLTKDIYPDITNGSSQTGMVDSTYAYATFSLSDFPVDGDQFTLTDWNNQNPITFTYVSSPSIEPTDISLTNLDAETLTLPQLLNSTLNAITGIGWYILAPTEGDTYLTIRQTGDGPLGNQENGTLNPTAIQIGNFEGGGVLNLYAPINGAFGQSMKLTFLNGNNYAVTLTSQSSEGGSWIWNEMQEIGPSYEIAPYRAVTIETNQVFPFYNLWSWSYPTGSYNLD